MKAVQPVDSAAAWRLLEDAHASPSAVPGKTCRWKQPLYVHMLCALHAPAPPVKIANNLPLSPVWGVDLLAAALQATGGHGRCLSGREDSFGEPRAKAEVGAGLGYAVTRERDLFPGFGQQSNSSFAAIQQGRSCLVGQQREGEQETRRAPGCCFCGHSTGFLVTCSYFRPVFQWRERQGLYRYVRTRPHGGTLEGRQLDEWQGSRRTLGCQKPKACCTARARKETEDAEDDRFCRRRFHPICGRQHSVHVLFRTNNGDSQSFFFCLEVRLRERLGRRETLRCICRCLDVPQLLVAKSTAVWSCSASWKQVSCYPF